ncbi:MAG: NAD-dependent epimerase/dehydratase family protein [Solirubrobacteraceae bacterium]
MESNGCHDRVLVTGASGLIGSHVVHALLEAGYPVRGFSRRPPAAQSRAVKPGAVGAAHSNGAAHANGAAQGNGAAPANGSQHVIGDVRDEDALAGAMRGCGAVIHTAGVYSYERADATAMMATNVHGTDRVLSVAARAGVRRIVVTSSAATCGPVGDRPADERDDPPDWELCVPYKRSKLAGERVALVHAAAGQDVVIVNPTTTVGAWDRRPTPSGQMVRDVITRRIRGYVGGGGLNVVSAADVARGHVLALERGASGERYLLGGENLAMDQVFALIARFAGVPAPRLRVPYRVALTAATALDAGSRALSRRGSSLLVLDEVRLARMPMYFAIDKAQDQLGYRPEPAAQALAAAVAWFTHDGRACQD